MAIISIKNLNFEYNEGSKTINDISFDIDKGEYVCILGHNGSGKSTITKLLIGLLQASSGSIVVNNIELNSKSIMDIRSAIGIVFQNPDNQFIGATVQDDIAFGLENTCVLHEEMQEIIEKFAKKVGVENFLKHEPGKLSGGQKQRVAIAGVLAMNPSIIILDEATSMLDPVGKREINELVRQIKKEQEMTIISITHDIEEALKADRIIILNQGKVAFDGLPKDIVYDNELLDKLSLTSPFVVRMEKALKKENIRIKNILNEDKLVDELWELNLKK